MNIVPPFTEQVENLHFFRAFVFLKLGAAKGKNISQIGAMMDRMRDDIDFNYNTTQLITDFVKDQDNRISLLSDNIQVTRRILSHLEFESTCLVCQEVMFLSDTVEDQKISLEELNYTITERQNEMSRLLSRFMVRIMLRANRVYIRRF